MRLLDLSIPVCDIKSKNFGEISPKKSQVINPESYSPKLFPMNLRRLKKELDDDSEDDESKEMYSNDENSKPLSRYNILKNKMGKKQLTPRNSPKKLSSYEEMVAKNRAERMLFLESLKMEEVKAGLSEAINEIKEKKKKTLQRVKRVYNQVDRTSPRVLRKSRRLAKMEIEFSKDVLYNKALKQAHETNLEKKIPPELPLKNALQFEELYDDYVRDLTVSEITSEIKPFPYELSAIKNMTLDENNIAEVTPDRINALAWYPSPEHLIVTAGSKYGNIGIWNVKSESTPYVLRIHYDGITSMKFSPYNSAHLFTSSYDGTLRCGDLVKQHFHQVYDGSDRTSCTYFDFLSQNTFLVAQRSGQVAIVDSRVEKKSFEKNHTCHDYSVKTVDLHPVNKHFFVTADNKGTIRLWDLRKLQKQPVADITHHKRCVMSAFFSPVTGNSILATSADDTLSLFDSTDLSKDVRLKQFMKHNNYTGICLSLFRATWLPNCEEAFVIGSMQDPCRIELFDKNLNVYHILMHPNLTTISSTNAFHPSAPALAGGNLSGQIFVFT